CFALSQDDCLCDVDETPAPKPGFSKSPSHDAFTTLSPAQFNPSFVNESEFSLVPSQARLQSKVTDRLGFPSACACDPLTELWRFAECYGHLDCPLAILA